MIRLPAVSDYPAIRQMLSDAGLPVEDFVAEHLARVAEEDGMPVAAIGFERFGEVGLLRSLVVAEGARVKGLGRKLVAELEALARAEGIREIWLLTIDADPYFLRLGYGLRDRDDAPSDIRGTAEFSGLCPDDAALMSKSLK